MVVYYLNAAVASVTVQKRLVLQQNVVNGLLYFLYSASLGIFFASILYGAAASQKYQ